MSGPPEVRWTGRAEPLIAEVAEALGVRTDAVMGFAQTGGVVTAMYTPPARSVVGHQ